jgi:hypothetical protein
MLQKFNENIPISLPTPGERTTVPTVVSRSFSSVRMRQRTGKAVIEYVTPAKQHEMGEHKFRVDEFLVHRMRHSRSNAKR